MSPIDALCELVDNALDSFEVAKLRGVRIENPAVFIELPSLSEVKSGGGRILVRDNGIGLTEDQAEAALRAGYSGNNPYDSLGLFGMGFNISTGKFGRETMLTTATPNSTEAVQVIVNLQSIHRARSYTVMPEFVPLPSGFKNGTIVSITEWWPPGDSNADFCRKLVQYGMPTVRRELGRRYASILRRSEQNRVAIYVNNEICTAYEHCVWSSLRFVTHKKHGQIHAQFRLNKVIGQHRRCLKCTAIVPESLPECPACNNSQLRDVEERVSGWIGVQRFDSSTEFGIDLVRNGRTIRIGEKAAFFEYTDDLKRVIRDYPADGTYGRIVGEIHLDHVPVDFLKQDFQRSSPEWQRAMEYIRGCSSLQPEQEGADQNKSPLFKLYQGYRKVRQIGKHHMYMGYFDEAEGKAKRISRDTEQEYYKRFLQKEPGYYDDEEWWKLVEAADSPPIPQMVRCPSCGCENLPDAEVCVGCVHPLKVKACINSSCEKLLPVSAQQCDQCGTAQASRVEREWRCLVCGASNPPDLQECSDCSAKQGTPNPMAEDSLRANSNKEDSLSIQGCSIKLADGTSSTALDVVVYSCRQPIKLHGNASLLPAVCFRSPSEIAIFIDPNHQQFTHFGTAPENLIAYEVATLVHVENARLQSANPYTHSVHNLAWQILGKHYSDRLEFTRDRVREEALQLFTDVRKLLPTAFAGSSEDAYNTLSKDQISSMVRALQHAGRDVSKLAEMKVNGDFFQFLDETAVLDLFREFPLRFFDGAVWKANITSLPDLPEEVAEEVRTRNSYEIRNCLEDICSFLQISSPSLDRIKRCRLSLDILTSNLAD